MSGLNISDFPAGFWQILIIIIYFFWKIHSTCVKLCKNFFFFTYKFVAIIDLDVQL